MSNVTNPLSAATSTSGSSTISNSLGNSLDSNAFLHLLITQLQNQDPMQPMDNTQSIAQLAQFSALEQMQQVNEKMALLNAESQISSASALIGRNITAQLSETDIITGKVSAVMIFDGMPMLMVNNQAVPQSSVIRIEP